jgi:hypothetical protein
VQWERFGKSVKPFYRIFVKQKALEYQKQVFNLVSEKVPYWRQTLLNDSQLARLCGREIQQSYSFDRSIEECASFIQDMITA